MPIYVEYILAFLLVAGGIFAFIGSYGLAKLNDFYMRLHGPTKATTLGLGCILAASSVYFTMTQDVVSLHEILITVFLFITAPVSAHLLSKTALAEGFHYSSDQGNPLNHPLNVGTRQTHDTTGVDDLTDDADTAYEREMESEEAAMMEEAHEADDAFDAAQDPEGPAVDAEPVDEAQESGEDAEEPVEAETADEVEDAESAEAAAEDPDDAGDVDDAEEADAVDDAEDPDDAESADETQDADEADDVDPAEAADESEADESEGSSDDSDEPDEKTN